MNDNTKDKIYELDVSGYGVEGKIKIQNTNNRVFAKIGDTIIDQLNYFRWSNAVRFFDKYEEKKKKES